MTQQEMFNGHTSPGAWRAQRLAATQAHDMTVAELRNHNKVLADDVNYWKARTLKASTQAGLLGFGMFILGLLAGLVASGAG